jgi:hypothetical protein
VQEASPGTFHRCAAACGLRPECTAFSLSGERSGDVCTLRGALHAGLIPHLRDLGEFALDPRNDGTQEVKAQPDPVSTEYRTRNRSPAAPKPSRAAPRRWTARRVQVMRGNTVCMRKLVRDHPDAHASAWHPCLSLCAQRATSAMAPPMAPIKVKDAPVRWVPWYIPASTQSTR